MEKLARVWPGAAGKAKNGCIEGDDSWRHQNSLSYNAHELCQQRRKILPDTFNEMENNNKVKFLNIWKYFTAVVPHTTFTVRWKTVNKFVIFRKHKFP